MAKRPLSWQAAQTKALLLANDPTTCAQWGEYELSGTLADRMEEIVYNHGYATSAMLSMGEVERARAVRYRIEKEFWELAKHEGIVALLEDAWAAGLADGGAQKNPAELLTLCSWCKGVIFDGPVGPQGVVSHGICYPCAVEHAEEFGLTDEELEELREEQGGAKKNPAGCEAFHMIVTGQDEEEPVESIFARIMQSGSLLCADLLPRYDPDFRYSPSFYATDILAGDTRYVFLQLGKPITGLRKSTSYGFVFDAAQLVRELDAVVGLQDLDGSYWELAESLAGRDPSMDHPAAWPGDSAERFQAMVPALQAAHRLRGQAALAFLAGEDCRGKELLVPGRLPLSFLTGLIVDGKRVDVP